MDCKLPRRPLLKIPFPLNRGEDFDTTEIYDFWDSASTIEWFRHHGYFLYRRCTANRGISRSTEPQTLTENLTEVRYPYSYHDKGTWRFGMAPLFASDAFTGKILYAQDSQERHVAIKLVPAESDEYRILRFVSQQSLDILKENCILPVLDFLPAEGFWLVVMPRWGSAIHLPQIPSYREVLTIMHSMLKSLSFLHQHNITHRDMKEGNMLVDHFGDDTSIEMNGARADLRSKGLLSYALMDFDISIMVPPEIKKEEYRLPYQLAWWGSFNQPKDVAQGEFDFNPFAYDVGTLGVEFCKNYERYVRDLPMLAPLLDRMATRNIQQRFTAAEALQFFEDRLAELTEDTLADMDYGLQATQSSERYDISDRWRDLSPDFVAKWASYREPPIPLTTKILRFIVYTPWFPHYIIPWIRWIFYKLSSSPRRIWTHFVGLGQI